MKIKQLKKLIDILDDDAWVEVEISTHNGRCSRINLLVEAKISKSLGGKPNLLIVVDETEDCY